MVKITIICVTFGAYNFSLFFFQDYLEGLTKKTFIE